MGESAIMPPWERYQQTQPSTPAAVQAGPWAKYAAPVDNTQQMPVNSGKPSFLGQMANNFKQGIQSGKDLLSGDFEDFDRPRITPRTQALADKLFPPDSEGSFKDFVSNVPNTVPSDWSGALLEKFGNTAEGKALSVIGGLNPVYNAVGTAVDRYALDPIAENTGIAKENLQLGLMATAPFGLKSAAKAKDPATAIAKNSVTNTQPLRNVKKGISARGKEELQSATAGMKSDAVALRNKAELNKLTLLPEESQSLASSIDEALAGTELIPEFSPKTNKIVQLIKEKSENGQLNVNQLDQYRRLLRSARDEDTVAAGAVRRAIDNTVNNLKTEGRNPDSVNLLNQFRKDYAQASKFEDVADLIAKADGDPVKIKRSLTTFKNNKDNLRGWSDAEKAALEKAATTGKGEWVLKGLGRFGLEPNNVFMPTAGGAALGATIGPVPAAGIVGAGTLARPLSRYVARGKAENLLQTIEQGGKGKSNLPANIIPAPKPAAALPAMINSPQAQVPAMQPKMQAPMQAQPQLSAPPPAQQEQPELKPQSNLFNRVIKQESGGRQLDKSGKPLTSPKGAIGIAQIMPATAPEAARYAGLEFDPERYRYDADYNAALGKAYLDKQLDKYNQNLAHALIAYNWGPGNTDKWLKKGGDYKKLPDETKQYIANILMRG